MSACCIPNCQECQPHRICHWTCDQCGGGPFRFGKTDPGQYKVLRPQFERMKQQYVMNEHGVGRWVYSARRICSMGCWQQETRAIHGDEIALAQKRPDLAPAIVPKVEAEQDAMAEAEAIHDDLDAIAVAQHAVAQRNKDAVKHPMPGQY